MSIDLHARDIEASHTVIRAILKRRRQLLTTDDADLLIALREMRQADVYQPRKDVQ